MAEVPAQPGTTPEARAEIPASSVKFAWSYLFIYATEGFKSYIEKGKENKQSILDTFKIIADSAMEAGKVLELPPTILVPMIFSDELMKDNQAEHADMAITTIPDFQKGHEGIIGKYLLISEKTIRKFIVGLQSDNIHVREKTKFTIRMYTAHEIYHIYDALHTSEEYRKEQRLRYTSSKNRWIYSFLHGTTPIEIDASAFGYTYALSRSPKANIRFKPIEKLASIVFRKHTEEMLGIHIPDQQ